MAMIDDLTNGPLEKARKHLEKDGRRAAKFDKAGHPFVALAARHGRSDLVALLLDFGASPDAMSKPPARPPWAISPLTEAVLQGHDEVVTLLLERGAKPDGPDITLRPVASAALMDRVDLLEQLSASGARLDRPAMFKQPPLVVAAGAGALNTVRWLLDRGHEIDDPGRSSSADTPLSMAASRGRLATVRFLLERGAAVHPEKGKGALPALIYQHEKAWFEEMLDVLLDAGADPSWARKYSLSTWRTATTFPSALAALLKRRRPKAADEAEMLSGASGESLDQLLEAGLDPNAIGVIGPALFAAPVEKARKLLAHGASLDLVWSERDALTTALQHGNADTARLLLEVGIDPAPTVRRGDTLLADLVSGGKAEAADLLRDLLGKSAPAGPSAELAERGLKLDVDTAVRHVEDAETLALLLTAGLDPSSVDDDEGWSLLTWALVQDAEDSALVLLDAGVEATPETDVDGEPLIDVVVRGSYGRLLERLYDAGLEADFSCDGQRGLEAAVRHDCCGVFERILARVAAEGGLPPARALGLAATAIDHSSDRESVAVFYLDALAPHVPEGAWATVLEDGSTLLSGAERWRDEGAIAWLRKHGAD